MLLWRQFISEQKFITYFNAKVKTGLLHETREFVEFPRLQREKPGTTTVTVKIPVSQREESRPTTATD